METVYKKARAKVNLTLNVLERRSDGYHNLETIFQKISLYDEIYVSKVNRAEGIKINTNIIELEGEDNIIFKAYEVLKNKFKNITGVDVTLKKNIPIQAGLAGGSTDCATFIECINKLFSLNLSLKEMVDIGVTLGADVPQAFYNMPVVARGVGEMIEEIESKAKYYIIAIKPNFSCNTKKMYEKLDSGKEKVTQKYTLKDMRQALEQGNVKKIAKNLYNVFENEVDNIESIKQEVLKAGALGGLMSGSGSTVFGVFEDKEKAKEGYRKLKQKYETYYSISYCKGRKE